jgi:hypothetical protein
MPFQRNRRTRYLPRPGRALAALVLSIYFLAGVLHGLHGVDVASPAGEMIVSINQDGDSSEKGIAAEHHCHGCFSVSIPAPLIAAAGAKPAQEVVIPRDIQRRGRALGIDPPPPKLLT